MARKMTVDGNESAAYVAYAFTETAAIYPITPSSSMAEHVDNWSAKGVKNIFGHPVQLVEMQSEAGAAGAMHGAMQAGVLTSTYTSSQGLLLMVPTMYRIAGHLKPGVIHVAARSVATNGYSIMAEHSDVMACRQTGFAILASASVQEVMDLAAVSHLASIQGSLPFLHFFDGFRTSHEIQKIDVLEYETLAELVDREALSRFRQQALHPEHPTGQSPGFGADIYFQSKEIVNPYYDRLPDIVDGYMKRINELTGRDYKLFNYYGDPEAESVIVAIGSIGGTIRETVEHLQKTGEKVGLLLVRLYRPFSASHFLEEIPKTAKTVTVMDRTKEPGALGEPLYEDICSAYNGSGRAPRILACRFGLGGKDTTPAMIAAIFDNAKKGAPMNHFTLGINDDVTHRSLPVGPDLNIVPEGTISCKFWGLGSDGTVGANKNTIKIIGENTELYVQAYFDYAGRKSGGMTKSHLRFGVNPIHSSYYVQNADFIACSNSSYITKYDIVSDLLPGGAFLLNTPWGEKELDEKLPAACKSYLARNKIRFYTIDAIGIAKELGMAGRTNMVLQAAFFKIVNIIPLDEAVRHMKEFARISYESKGEKTVAMNCAAIDRGIADIRQVEIPSAWAEHSDEWTGSVPLAGTDFELHHLIPSNDQRGDAVPVSAFASIPDSGMPPGTSKLERRGVAVDVPVWDPDRCIQCNQCAYVCPHTTIRPFLLNEDEAKLAPAGFVHVPAIGKGLENYRFSIQVATLDCIGCGSCVGVCPAKEKALSLHPLQEHGDMSNWDYAQTISVKEDVDTSGIKGSQFLQPLLEVPGACPGCGETPYVRLLTQLYGDRMYVTAATGCAAVWATMYPSFPYNVNRDGHGPALTNSLFENNGEFGYGIQLGVKQMRERLHGLTEKLVNITTDSELKSTSAAWLEAFYDGKRTKAASVAYRAALGRACAVGEEKGLIDEISANAEHLTKKSVWIIGGDGWAYDIGYGGLDHVLSMGEDVNILVLDNEAYSNTGGQASKATPRGAIASFSTAGMKFRKKDLGMMAMAYKDVYVAQVAMGADMRQTLKALEEAESYPGTSMVIAYAPCINHGLSCGMGGVQEEMKRAVGAGYWHLYRFDPRRGQKGENPFVLDSKEPSESYRDFLMGEARYASLPLLFPEQAAKLFEQAEKDAKDRLGSYRSMANR